MNALNDIISRLGITPSEMQRAAYEAISSDDHDVILLSPTGSGKTLAYLMPLVTLLDATNDDVQAVVVVPGRELAIQSADVLRGMGTQLRGYASYGGRMTMDEHRQLRQMKPHIVFATPGRLNDHLQKGNITTTNIKYVVIDEYDKCLEMGFEEVMADIASQLSNAKRRIVLTATPPTDGTTRFTEVNAVTLNFVEMAGMTSDRVHIYKVLSPSKDKLETLAQLLLGFGDQSSIVFVNYRESVERVGDYLTGLGFSVSCYHGGLDQQERERRLYKFICGSANILVSTDLASRGLDIPHVENIVHYHLPETNENYIHRIGRTTRWDSTGRSFFIVSSGEEKRMRELESNVEDYDMPSTSNMTPAEPRNVTLYIGRGKKDKISKGDIVGFLCKKGGLRSDEIGRIDIKERYAYAAVPRQKAKQVLRNVQGEKIKKQNTKVETIR